MSLAPDQAGPVLPPDANNPLLSTSYSSVNAPPSNNPTAYVANSIYSYVLRTKASVGIGGFKLDYTGEESVTLEADITDHFVENNTAVQDQIALKPLRFTVRGMVSDLTVEAPSGVQGLLTSLAGGLAQVEAYLGKYTPGMVQTMAKAITQVQNVTNEISQDLSKVQNIVSLIPGVNVPIDPQEIAFNQLFALYLSQSPIMVDTPFGTLVNMVIERLTMSQPEGTTNWSDVSVTVKQLRFVEIMTTPDTGEFSGRLAQQGQSQTNKGSVQSNAVPTSAAVQLGVGMGWLSATP